MAADDNELVLLAREGNGQAFEQLVGRYDRQVLSLALSYTRNGDDAKDVYQEVFLRVYRALPKFKFESQFSTWLFRVATNVCLTYRQRSARHVHTSIDQALESEEGLSRAMTESLTGGRSADRQMLDSEIGGRVERAMDALSPRQKMVFVLKHHHGMKLREIAVQMNCAEGTVKKYLFTATERLRNQLKDVYE